MRLFEDPLNTRVTFPALLILAVLLWIKQIFLRSSISCNVPSHFTGSQTVYAHETCSNAEYYTIPDDFLIPMDPSENERSTNNAGKIIPYMFLLQAFLTVLPLILWNCFKALPLTPIKALTSTAKHCTEAKDFSIYKSLCDHMSSRLKQYMQGSKIPCYLGISYAFVRLLYCIFAFVNLSFVLRLVPLSDLPFYKDTNISMIINGDQDTNSSTIQVDNFPKVVMCDYKVLRLGNVQSYTIQCTLSENYSYEALLQVVAVWFLFLGTINVMSFVRLVINIFLAAAAQLDISPLIQSLDQSNNGSSFKSKLGCDGALMTAYVSQTASDAVAANMLSGAMDQTQEQIIKPTTSQGYNSESGY